MQDSELIYIILFMYSYNFTFLYEQFPHTTYIDVNREVSIHGRTKIM